MLLIGRLTFLKFHFATLMKSTTLQKGGICSLIGAFLSNTLFVNTVIIKNISEAWWIYPFVAWGCAVAAICIGPNTVAVANCIHEIPIWSFRWWLISSGDGIDEMTGQEPEPDDQYSIVGHGSFTSLFSELK